MDTTLFLRVFSLNYFGERVIIMMELLQLIVVIKVITKEMKLGEI